MTRFQGWLLVTLTLRQGKRFVPFTGSNLWPLPSDLCTKAPSDIALRFTKVHKPHHNSKLPIHEVAKETTKQKYQKYFWLTYMLQCYALFLGLHYDHRNKVHIHSQHPSAPLLFVLLLHWHSEMQIWWISSSSLQLSFHWIGPNDCFLL